MIRRGIDVLLGLALLAASSVWGAWAADWFEGPYCFENGCAPSKKCSKATESPAQVYEKLKLVGAEIVDKADGRVDVVFAYQGARLHQTFFAMQKAASDSPTNWSVRKSSNGKKSRTS